MHELSITQHLLDIVITHAERAQARRVTDIFLVIGDLSSLIDDSIQYYWDIICAGTPAEGAVLHFERRPPRWRCQSCNREHEQLAEGLVCPACGGRSLVLSGGQEFYVESITIETEEQTDA